MADSGGVLPLAAAIHIEGPGQELLLNVPYDENEAVSYRLYSRKGVLITASDGAHTYIFAYLRMEAGRAWPGGA